MSCNYGVSCYIARFLQWDIFCRGGDGELRLGIRRAVQIKSCATALPITNQQFNASSISAVVTAISTRSTFDICYNPRYICFQVTYADVVRKMT